MTAKHATGLVHHAVIDREFRELVGALRAGDGRDPCALYRALHERIKDHMRAEDDAFERFASVEPEEARALIAEHRAIEAVMDALAADAARGALQLHDVHELKVRFTIHEAREESGFYRRAVDDSARGSLAPTVIDHTR